MQSAFPFLAGGGACGALIADHDWARTSLGPIESWPVSLTATIANMLHTRQPMLLFWGPDLIQFYNDAFVPSFGQGKHPQALGQPARECWTDAWPVIGAQIEAVMTRGEPAWHEDTLVPIHRNGRMEEVFWTYSYSPAFDDLGHINGTLVIVTEMTGRVLSARRLALLASVDVALSAASTTGAVFAALRDAAASNPADLPFMIARDGGWELVHGMDVAQAERLYASRTASADLTEVTIADERIKGTAWPEPVTHGLACSLGTRRWLMVGVSPRLPLDDGYRSFVAQLVGRVAAALQRIDTANAVVAVQRERDNLLMHAPVATALTLGPAHTFELANPLYREIAGREVAGKSFREAFPELVGTEVPGIFDRAFETGEPYVAREQIVPLDRAGTGTPEDCYFNYNIEPLKTDDGKVYGLMIVAVEITEQVRARIELERSAEERSHMLLELRASNRMKDEFLAMLGHELRNPLAPIVTALELLDHKGTPGGPERAIIERQVRHVIRLVDDLLDVSRITRGAVALDMRVIDLRSVVSTAVESARHLIDQRGHRLVIEMPHAVHVDGDEDRLVQVALNLISNAARYTPDGGTIRIAVDADHDEAVLRVEDDGPGISADLLPKVFEPFVQGARSADRAEGGLGLGLAIVKNLVSLHGGTASVVSDGPGKGSTFCIRLRRVEPIASVATTSSRRLTPAADPKRILVVDDNEDAGILLGELARMQGHEVTVVQHPEQALAIVAGLQPHVAVLDIGLPGMDGYQLAARVRSVCPECRLIALTGYGQEGDRARAQQAGFAQHLVKPIRAEQLLAALG